MFGKFAQMDPTDVKRDKFLKRQDDHKGDKKGKALIKDDQLKHDQKHAND